MEITKENAISIVWEEIDIITYEQIKIIKYNEELEDRRLRLLEFIKRSEQLNITKEAQNNLLLNVSHMEMEVLRTGKAHQPSFKERTEVKDVKKCRFNNTGYCKYQNECRFKHSENVCETYLRDGKCENKHSCQSRHPKPCKYWKREPKECKRKESCKYLHKDIQPSVVKTLEENTNASEVDNEVEMIPVNDKETIGNTEEISGTKEEELKQLEDVEAVNVHNEVEANLKSENEKLRQQVEKLQRVAVNMFKELKEIKS